MNKLRHKLHDQEGATAVEYGIMVALIAVVIIGVVMTLGTTLRDDVFGEVNSCLDDPTDCESEE